VTKDDSTENGPGQSAGGGKAAPPAFDLDLTPLLPQTFTVKIRDQLHQLSSDISPVLTWEMGEIARDMQNAMALHEEDPTILVRAAAVMAAVLKISPDEALSLGWQASMSLFAFLATRPLLDIAAAMRLSSRPSSLPSLITGQ
jgi:hypothetical protein